MITEQLLRIIPARLIYTRPNLRGGAEFKTEWCTAELRDSHEDTVKGGNAHKGSIEGVIIILLTPAPVIDPFPAWKPPKEPAKVGGFGCLEFA